MSLSYQKLTPVEVLDPITDVQTKRDYSILKGGDKISYKAFTSTSISSSSIQFSCPPPIRSPVAFYGDGLDGSPTQRGSFPFTILSTSNIAVVPTLAGTVATAVVDMVVTEPLFLSPLYWGHHNSQGLYNVNSLDYNISFY